jgi:hypothetical protein
MDVGRNQCASADFTFSTANILAGPDGLFGYADVAPSASPHLTGLLDDRDRSRDDDPKDLDHDLRILLSKDDREATPKRRTSLPSHTSRCAWACARAGLTTR